MYYDAHTHLNEERLFVDRKGYIEKFVAIGGKGLVNVGASREYNHNALEISKNRESEGIVGCFVGNVLGLHPLEVVEGHVTEQNIADEIKKLSDFLVSNRKYIIGIGETGIDLHYQNTPEILELEKKLFIAQCDLARELGLPLVIHSRAGFEPTIEILKNYTDLKIYFHCRGYGPAEYEVLNELLPNLWIGFTGNVTYKKADEIRDTLKAVRKDQILLETDAPYLAPQVIRGELNHPANVKYVYDFSADFLGISNQDLCQLCEDNFKKFYNVS